MPRFLRLIGVLVLLPFLSLAAQQHRAMSGPPTGKLTEPFSQVAAIRVLDADRAIVLDQIERTVILVNFRSDQRQVVGHNGEGPGEYRYPRTLVSATDGNTWLHDASLARLLLIDTQGRITSSRGVPAIPGSAAVLIGSDSRGGLYFETSKFDPERGTFADSVTVVRWDPASDRQRSVRRVWAGGRVTINRPSGPASLAREITPFPHIDHWVVLPDGRFVMVKHEPYQVEVTDLAGHTQIGPVLTSLPVQVTARDRAEYREANSGRMMGAMMRGGGVGQVGRGPEFRDEDFPRFKPTVQHRHVVASANGETWIGRSQPAGAGETVYDVLASDGRKLREVRFDGDVRVVAVTALGLYLARTDVETGLVFLERYTP